MEGVARQLVGKAMKRAGDTCLALILACAAGMAPAAAPGDLASIDVTLGQTVYFQLVDTTPGRNGDVVRVENPNRDTSVVKATFQAGSDGVGRLSIRNGYENGLSMAMNEGCGPAAKPTVLRIIRAGSEATVLTSPGTAKVVLCQFSLVGNQAFTPAPPSWMQQLQLGHSGAR